MPRLNLAHMMSQVDDTAREELLKEMLDKQCSPDDPPYLSDICKNNKNGGIYVMEALGAKEEYYKKYEIPQEGKFRWHLQVLGDEYGKPVKPGDKVIRSIQKPVERAPGLPLSSRDEIEDKINGVYDEKWKVKIPFTIDEKGCITCEFASAVHFLITHGIHGKSGKRLSFHTMKTGPDGQLYWRFREVDKEEYEKLPLLKKEERKAS